jgi:hypothetical protein
VFPKPYFLIHLLMNHNLENNFFIGYFWEIRKCFSFLYWDKIIYRAHCSQPPFFNNMSGPPTLQSSGVQSQKSSGWTKELDLLSNFPAVSENTVIWWLLRMHGKLRIKTNSNKNRMDSWVFTTFRFDPVACCMCHWKWDVHNNFIYLCIYLFVPHSLSIHFRMSRPQYFSYCLSFCHSCILVIAEEILSDAGTTFVNLG